MQQATHSSAPEVTQLPEFLLILSLECCLVHLVEAVLPPPHMYSSPWEREREEVEGKQFPFTVSC